MDIRYFQELVGHGSIEATERYTHVTQKGMERIKSPLDKVVGGEDARHLTQFTQRGNLDSRNKTCGKHGQDTVIPELKGS